MSDYAFYDKNDLLNHLRIAKPAVWRGSEKIHEILDEIGRELTSSSKFKIKLCYDFDLKNDIKVHFENGSQTFSDFSSFVKYVFDNNLEKKVKEIMVNSNDKLEVIKLFKQLLNLGIKTDIYTSEEYLKLSVIDYFYKRVKDLNIELTNFTNWLSSYKSDNKHIIKIVDRYYKSTEEMKEAIKKSSDRIIKLAIFATKKSGKSMVVNSLLGDEYAPTSIELATPTIIKYVPHNSEKILVKIDDNEKEFDNALEIRKELLDLFGKLNLKGKKMPVITIRYPQKLGVNYIIYDTPGPDLAGSEHKDFIPQAIEESDVAVFLIDYSKYAQEDEIKLLKQVIKSYHDRKKNYSFIVLINKLDLIFQDALTEKIPVRVSDFIYYKIKDILSRDFDIESSEELNFMVFTSSAMMDFYLKKLLAFMPVDKNEKFNDFIDKISQKLENDELNEEYNSEIQTYISNLEGFSTHLRRQMNIKDPTIEDLFNKCGFNAFEWYLNYVIEKKAFLEKVWNEVIGLIDMHINSINNELKLNASELKRHEINKIKEILNDFLEKNSPQKISSEFDNLFSNNKQKIKKKTEEAFHSFFKEIERYLERSQITKESQLKEVNDEIKTIYVAKGESQKEIIKNELERIIKTKLNNIIEFNFVDYKKHLKEGTNSCISEIQYTLEEFKKNIEQEFKEHKNNLAKEVDKLNKRLREIEEGRNFTDNYQLKISDFVFDFGLNRVLYDISQELEKLRVESRGAFNIKIVQTYKKDFWDKTWNFFADLFNTKRIENKYEIKIDKEEFLKNNLKELDYIFTKLKLEIKNLMEESSNQVKTNIYNSIDVDIEKYKNLISKDLNYSIFIPISEVKQNLELTIDDRESIFNFSLQTLDNFYQVNDIWDEIMKIYDDRR